MERFNGLNGTILLNTPRDGELALGTIPGEAYGYRTRLRVSVGIRIERLERRETYETTTHETVTGPLDLTVTSSVWTPSASDILTGGATREPIRELARTGKPGRFWRPEGLEALASIGDRWHLNAMRAACAHQTVVYEEGRYGRQASLTETPPCPETGYRYGTSWLVEMLPDDVVTELRGLLAGPVENRNLYVHPDFQ